MLLCNDPQREAEGIGPELKEVFERFLRGDSYILGSAYERFTRDLADYLKVDHCIGVASGTDALVLSLKALDLCGGDEVILPSHTAAPTAMAVLQAGLSPVFADIDPDSMCLDPSGLEKLLSPRTKVVIAVHLYGYPVPVEPVAEFCSRHGLALIEDCAQSIGAEHGGGKTGSTGLFGCYSFYPTKPLGALGDGGAVVTSDPVMAARVSQLRQYGWDQQRVCQTAGMNSRLDELQAAILAAKLPRLEARTKRRGQIASHYAGQFAGLPIVCPTVPDGARHAFHQFVIRVRNRDGLHDSLNSRGIGSAIHYPQPLHNHPAFAGCRRGDLAVTEQVVGEILSLPAHPDMVEGEIEAVVAAVSNFYGKCDE